MNIDDALRVLEAVVDLWPNEQAWSDRTGEAWIAQLTHHEFEVVRAALVSLHSTKTFRPAWAEVAEQIRAEKRAMAAHAPALPAAPVDLERQADQVKRVERVSRRALFEHRNHTRAGAGKCWCAAHDHSNRTAFGITITYVLVGPDKTKREHHDPVPGWWFDCPQCGDPQSAQHFCSMWTPAGIAFMKAARPGEQVVVVPPVAMEPTADAF